MSHISSKHILTDCVQIACLCFAIVQMFICVLLRHIRLLATAPFKVDVAASEETKNYAELDEAVSECCNQVCTMNVLRAMARPRPDDTPRKILLEKSNDIVKQLRGVLSPKLGLLLEGALKEAV